MYNERKATKSEMKKVFDRLSELKEQFAENTDNDSAKLAVEIIGALERKGSDFFVDVSSYEDGDISFSYDVYFVAYEKETGNIEFSEDKVAIILDGDSKEDIGAVEKTYSFLVSNKDGSTCVAYSEHFDFGPDPVITFLDYNNQADFKNGNRVDILDAETNKKIGSILKSCYYEKSEKDGKYEVPVYDDDSIKITIGDEESLRKEDYVIGVESAK